MPNSDPIDLIDGMDSADDVSKPEFRAELKAALRAFSSANDVRNTDLSGRTRIIIGDFIFKKNTEDTQADDGQSIVIDSAGNHWVSIVALPYAMYATKTDVEGSSVPTVVNSFRLSGYRSVGDGGAALYKRVASEPSHDLKIQSADGAWWEFAGDTLYPEHAGAYNDDTNTGAGVHTDSAAFQSCIDYLRTLTNGGELTLRKGSGYRLTTALDCYPSVPLAIRGEPGSQVFVDNTTVSDVMFKITHPTDPTTRAPGRFSFQGEVTIQVRSNVVGSVGPCLVEARRASDLAVEGGLKLVHYANNTALRCSDLWNARWMGKIVIWGSGHRKPYKVATGTFSMSSGGTTLTSTASDFSSADVGHTILLADPTGVIQQFTLATYVSGTSFTTSKTAVAAFSGASGLFDHTKGTLTNGSADIVLEVAPATTDVGRYVVIPGAVDLTSPVKTGLRAKITAVNVGTKTITVDANAPNDHTGYVYFSPGVELIGEGAVSGLSNDVRISSLHIEEPRALPLYIGGTDASNSTAGAKIVFDFLKLHAQNGQTGSAATDCLAVINATSLHIGTIDAEGSAVGDLGMLHIEGCFAGVTIDKWEGTSFPGVKAINPVGNYPACKIQIGPRLLYAPNVSSQAVHDAIWPDPAPGSGKLIMLGAGGGTPGSGLVASLDSKLQLGGDRLRKVGDATDDEDALNRQSGDARFGKPFGTSRLTSRWYPAVAGAYEKSVAVATLDTVLYAYPFKIDRPTTIKSFYTRVVTGAAGSAVKLGIWAHDDATERPTSTAITGLVSNTGQATTTSGANAGLGSLNKLLSPGWYWFGCAFTTLAPTMSSLSGALPGQNPIEALIGRSAIAGANIICALSTPFTYSSDITTLDLTGVTWADVAGDAGVPIIFLGT